MKKQFKASGLFLVAVSGFAASSAASVTATDKGNTSSVGKSVAEEDLNKCFKLEFIECLDYGEQKKIYKDLTANRFGFFGEELLSSKKSDISKKFANLYEKDSKKFNNYINDNYGLNLVVYDWVKDPSKEADLNRLLDKINENERIKREKSIKEGKPFVPKLVTAVDLMKFPTLALDYALEEKDSKLLPGSDRSIIKEKVRENAKYIGINDTLLNSVGGSLGIVDSYLANSSESDQKLFRNVVTNTIHGEETAIPKSKKIKYIAKEGAAVVGVLGLVASGLKLFQMGYKKLLGSKHKDDETENKKKSDNLQDMLKPFPD